MHGINAYLSRILQLAPDPPVILEAGAYDTQLLRLLRELDPGRLHRHVLFEPDPRNAARIRSRPLPEGATLVEAAVGAIDGRCTLHLSTGDAPGREWSFSSSIRRPKEHLHAYPHVRFLESVEVDIVRLDTWCRAAGIDRVDLLWTDLQGAERDLVEGGRETLSRTRFLYLEREELEMYEGQWTSREMLDHFAPDWDIVELYPKDVLLANRKAM